MDNVFGTINGAKILAVEIDYLPFYPSFNSFSDLVSGSKGVRLRFNHHTNACLCREVKVFKKQKMTEPGVEPNAFEKKVFSVTIGLI